MLINHHTHPQIVTGAEKALLMLGSACLELEVQVSWISPTAGLSHERAAQMGMDARVIPFSLLWSLIYDPAGLDQELSLLQGTVAESGLDQMLAHDMPNLVVANSAINAMPALIARKRKLPFWWYIHEVLPQVEATDRLLSLIHSYTDRILVPSQTAADSIGQSNLLTNTITLLPYGVEIPPVPFVRKNRKKIRSEHEWTDNHVVVGWFGSIYQGKGLLEFIRAGSFFQSGTESDPIHSCGKCGGQGVLQLLSGGSQKNEVCGIPLSWGTSAH